MSNDTKPSTHEVDTYQTTLYSCKEIGIVCESTADYVTCKNVRWYLDDNRDIYS